MWAAPWTPFSAFHYSWSSCAPHLSSHTRASCSSHTSSCVTISRYCRSTLLWLWTDFYETVPVCLFLVAWLRRWLCDLWAERSSSLPFQGLLWTIKAVLLRSGEGITVTQCLIFCAATQACSLVCKTLIITVKFFSLSHWALVYCYSRGYISFPLQTTCKGQHHSLTLKDWFTFLFLFFKSVRKQFPHKYIGRLIGHGNCSSCPYWPMWFQCDTAW